MSRRPFRRWLKAIAADVVRLLNSPSTGMDPIPSNKMKFRLPFVAGMMATTLLGGLAPAQDIEDLESASTTLLEVEPSDLDPSKIRFTPPPPPEPAPDVPLAIRSSVRKATHLLTLGRGEPSTLPDIPPPPAPRQIEATSFPIHETKREFFLGLSATVYLNAGRPFTRVLWRDPETREDLEAWCAWDWSLLAPMFEVSGDEVAYSLIFAPLVIDLDRRDTAVSETPVPNLPDLESGRFVITKGNPDAASGSGFLAAVRRYLFANRERLTEVRAARERVRAEKEAWDAANPWQPRDHMIVLRPHRGSRYLETAEGEEER